MKSKSNVDVIIPLFRPPYIGGTETVIRKWDEYFFKNKDNIGISIRFILPFAFKDSSIFKKEHGNYVYFPRFSNNEKLIKFFGMIYTIFYFIFTKADNIIVLSPRYIKLGYFLKKIFRKKYLITAWIHFSLDKMFIDDGNAFRYSDYHLAISSGIKKQLLDMGVNDNKIKIVFNPISKTDKYIKKSSYPKYIYVGRLEYNNQKNLNELIRSFKLVNDKMPNSKLELWGDGKDSHELMSLVKDLGLSKNVFFKGWSKDPWNNISSATAVVMTSKFEGLPMTILEAISNGIPVISSDISTGPSDEINSNNGFLYESGNVNELFECMIKVFERNQYYNPDMLKESIDKFYESNYFTNLINVLKEME